MTGRSFAGCVNYNLGKADAELLDAKGLRTDNAKFIIDDFNLQRKLNTGLGKAVGHIALSWSIHDKKRLSSDNMAEVALMYMERMGIRDTQYLIVQHNDKPHPHLHIVYNRVDDNGKTISDQFQKQRNAKICKDITLTYDYHFASGKEKVNRERLNGSDALKYELYDQVTKAIAKTRNWPQLKQLLDKQDINILFKYRSGTKEIQGVSFSKYDVQMKGSHIDRSLSYGNISKQLELNSQQDVQQPPNPEPKLSLADRIRQSISEHRNTVGQSSDATGLDLGRSILDMGASISPDPEPPRKKRKNNNEQDEHRGYSR
ncbi:relaxase/mobilization nuclease domain-containing protein [soil metagenome]